MREQTRRHFLKTTSAAALGGTALLSERQSSTAQPAGQPSVLIIMCDQLNPSCLSGYGGPVPTPNIDRIASEGVQFGQATCPTPFCSPSRASLVNGLYPHAHGIVANCGARQKGITPDDVTTERILSESGYATHFYGKWHLIPPAVPYYTDMYRPAEYGKEMEERFEQVREGDPEGYMPFYNWAIPVDVDPTFRKAVDALGDKWEKERFAGFLTKMGRFTWPLEDHYDVRVANLTVDRLKAMGQEPFMVTCSFVAPHDPNVAPSPYYEAFSPESLELPANRDVREELFEGQWSRRIIADLGEPGLREFLRVYYAMVAMIDDQVGRVLQALEATGQADDTIVIFTADHGDMMGGHGMVWKSTSAFYEEVVRIPLLVRYPRKLEPGQCDVAASLVDMMPTILDLLERPTPEQVQGESLVPYMTGQQDESQFRPYAFSERVSAHPEGLREVRPGTKGSFMIRGKGWKYIRYASGQEYLYSLADDPGETRSLADDAGHADRKAELRAEMDNWLRETGFPGEV